VSSPDFPESSIRFGEFAADLEAGELHRNGTKVKLQGQPFEILALLLKHPGRIVTHEELRQRLWPSDTFVDFEHGLYAAVNRLREALGDSAEDPRFIETVPRRGYRFIGSVNLTVEPTKPMMPWGKGWLIALSLVGAIAAVLALLFALNVGGLRSRLRTAIAVKRAAALPRIESIAVLPFENLSGDPSQEYFSDGMTEELITNLGKLTTRRVISRTSVMRYKGNRKPLPDIARELNVDAIVEGTVQRSGNHVRVTANLLYAPTDRHLWAETYDSELEDVLIVQGRVAHSIANEIGIKLMSQEQRRLAATRPVNPEAYQAYLKGKYYAAKWNADGIKKGEASFRQAIDLDPTYAPAYEGLAEVHGLAAGLGLRPSTESFSLVKAAASKALELDEGLAEAHSELGMVKLQFDWDWSGAEQELRHAIALNPNSSSAHFIYGVFLTALGRSDEAVKETRNALELDPLTTSSNLQLGWVLYYARRHDESIAQLKETLELTPDFAPANMELGWNYGQKRMYREAVAECQRAVSLAPEDQIVLASCGDVYGLAGRRQDALALLDRLKKISGQGYVDPYNLAWLYDGLGDNNHTIEWLERAYRERSASLYGLRIETWSGPLRTDPRFQDLLRRMKFPP
jgi:TolB-like protein/DNA-binding winged helix-turn-helix (wHTH) protein/Tfp pilus assembly protein PilF